MVHVGLLEDNTRIARLCATMLQYAGHQVTVYNHPRACLDALLPSVIPQITNQSKAILASSHSIDVLILDLHLPEIPGLEVLRLLRSHAKTASLPLIFCTAATATEIMRALRMAPRALFVEKPFTYQELISAIAAVIEAQPHA